MSLLDVLDKQYASRDGSSNRSSGGGLGSPSYDSPLGPSRSAGGSGGASGAASNSRERSAPERIDINNYVTSSAAEPGAGLQALEVAGRAPGWILERPLATAQTAVKGATGFDIGETVGSVPILGAALGLAGGVLNNVTGLPSAVANASVAEGLKRGFSEGWSDDQIVPYLDNWDQLMRGVPFLGNIAAAMGSKPLEEITWADYKRRAAARGFGETDVQDLMANRKAPWDYGDRMTVEDGLGDIAFRLATDPTNLLLGAGVVAKIPAGLGLLGRMVSMGAALEKPLAVSEAAASIAKAQHLGATWLGAAEFFGKVGRTAGSVTPFASTAVSAGAKGLGAASKAGKAYQKLAIGTSAVELGIAGVDELAGGRQRPSSGFLEPLFEANRAVFDNQPLSQNTSFSILSAFMIGPHNVLGPGFRATKTAIRKFDQAGTRNAVLDALSEGMAGAPAARRARAIELLGGEDQLDNLLYHIHSRIVFDKVFANPALKAALETAGSLDEAALANAKVKDIVDAEIVAGLKEGRISKRQVLQSLKDWHAHRNGVDHSVSFPWDGELAATRWSEYTTAAGPISRVFQERAAAVIGLADDLTVVDLEVARASLRTAAVGGSVPIGEVRRVLSRYPQLLELDKGAWEQYLLPSANGTSVPMASINRALKKAMKDAPTIREVTHEMAAAEAGAARGTAPEPEPISPESARLTQLAVADRQVQGGGAFLNVSRMRDPIKNRLTRKFKLGWTTIGDVQAARADGPIAHFEENVGGALSDQGFPVDTVTQAAGLWEGKLEPSIEIEMSGATLDELRLAAATVGKRGDQDAVALAITGERIGELGLQPNGVEVVWSLPTSEAATIDGALAVLAREFTGGTMNDTLGTVRVFMFGDELSQSAEKLARVNADLEALLPKDVLGDTGMRHSVHKAYIEFPGKEGDLTYDGIIRQARADRDPRARAYLNVREQLAYRRSASGVAGAGDGSPSSVGREPRDGGLDSPDLAKPSSERVGLGERRNVVPEDGFFYRILKPEQLESIADDGLRTAPPAAGGSWPDGGSGPRSYLLDAKALSLSTSDGVVLRSKQAGSWANDRSNGQHFVRRRLRADELEVWGADGQWHPLEGWFTAPMDPAVAAAAATVAPAYPKVTAAAYGRMMADAFGGNDEQAMVYGALGEAMANSWSSRTGRPAADWYETVFAGIEKAPEGSSGQLHQISARNARIAVALEAGGDVKTLIEEPVPDVLAQHGLGGESPVEWVSYGGRDFGIPGGVEGLASGEFTLWDLWRLKAQGVDPNLIPENVRVPLYQKLFRTQMRALDNPVDAFNRVAFAQLSPLTNLTQNEALLTFVRARDLDGIARLAEVADRVETAARAAGKPAAQINSEIGFAVQQLVGIDTFPRGVKSIPTNGALASVAKAARVVRDNPDFFKLRDGEDLVQYSERLMNVLPGADMKVGNFAAMLGNPLAFDRGTIDSHIVEVLANEGRIPPEIAARLVKVGKDGTKQGDAPKGRKITYRMADGSYHPDLPEHLRDLPIDPAGNKVTIYDRDYLALNEALKQRFSETELSGSFGLGGYQWYEWDLKRGKFEPHTVIYPGSHELPPIEQAGLVEGMDAHREMGYQNRTAGLTGSAVSPTRALYYQEAPRPAPQVEWVSVDAIAGSVRENREAMPRAGQGATSLDELTETIRTNGFDPTRPITLRYNSKHHAILLDDGNHRFAVARRLGLTEIPAIVKSEGPERMVHYKAAKLGGSAVEAARGDLLRPSEIGLPSRPVEGNQVLHQVAREVDPQYEVLLSSARTKADAAERSALGHMEAGNVKEAQKYQAEADRWRRAEQEYLNKPRLNQVEPGYDPFSAADQSRMIVEEYGGVGRWWGDEKTADVYRGGSGSMRVSARFRPEDAARFVDSESASGIQAPRDSVVLITSMEVNVNGKWHQLPLPEEGLFLPIGEGGVVTGAERAADFTGPELFRAGEAGVPNYFHPLEQGGGTVIKGSAELLDSGQAVIRGVTNPDFSTGVHELWHAAQRHIDPEDLSIMERHYGVQDGVWLSEHQEMSARDFERYLRDGKAPTPALAGTFAKMRQFLTAVYARLKGSPIEKQIHPEIRGVFDRALTELPTELRPAARVDPIGVGFRAIEDEGLPPVDTHAPLRADLAAGTDGAATRLEQAGLARDEVRRQGVLYMAQRDAEVSRSIPLHRSLDDRPVEVRAELQQLQDELSAHYGPYVLKAPPKLATFFEEHQGDLIAEHLKNHSALGEVLATWGPFGRINRLVEWLTAPVENSRMGTSALQALYNELLPHGAKPDEVKRFVSALGKESHIHTIGPFEVRTFKNGTSLTQQAINKMAAGDPIAGLAPIFSEKTIAAIGRDGFARALDRASNRFYQTAYKSGQAMSGKGSLARAFTRTFDGYQKTAVGTTGRYVSKTMYHWFRFLSDPRWWAMNVFEADMLGGLRYGINSTRFTGAHKAPMGPAAMIHELGDTGVRAQKEISETLGGADTGWLYTRRLGGFVSRSFDHERPESTLAVLRSMADDDPILADLRGRFGSADDDIVEGIDQMLYSWDTKGPRTTLIEEAQATLGAAEAERLMPFLNKVWQRHEQTYEDIVRTFHGNPNRSNLERIGNSYWLYWPLSYQVKATKWLVDVMTNKFAGHQTNLAPAAVYAQHYEDHKRRMAEVPAYAQMFADQPTLWFMAQMLFPLTPGDMGVSLSRPVRYAGGKLGLWGDYKSASDPVTAAGAILSLGPTYSAQLMARVGAELFGQSSKNLAPTVPTSMLPVTAPLGPPTGQGSFIQ